MTVIIPHPTEELKLIKYQKELIKLLNNNGTVSYRHQPLWIELTSPLFCSLQKDDLKSAGKKINSITFGNIEANQNEVFTTVNLKMETGLTEQTKLPLVHFYKKNGSEDYSSLPPCPVSCLKIFRLALSTMLSENSQAITDSIWIKL